MVVKETKIFELDDDIAKDIIELNKLGYFSSYSCSGHIEEFDKIGLNLYTMGTYISFDNITRLRLAEDKGYDIPNNWVYTDRDNQLIIRRHYTQEEIDLFSKRQLLELTWKELHDWIKRLSRVGYFNIIDYDIEKLV